MKWMFRDRQTEQREEMYVVIDGLLNYVHAVQKNNINLSRRVAELEAIVKPEHRKSNVGSIPPLFR